MLFKGGGGRQRGAYRLCATIFLGGNVFPGGARAYHWFFKRDTCACWEGPVHIEY